MIKILEGVDGVGKSSHAAWLAKETNAKIIHAGIPMHDHWHKEYVMPVLDHLLDHPDQDLILDRWHVGEMIWPTIFGRPSLFKKFDSFQLCHDRLLELGAEVLFVYREADAITNTLMLRGEQDQVNDVLRAQDLFMDLIFRVDGIKAINSNELQREITDAH